MTQDVFINVVLVLMDASMLHEAETGSKQRTIDRGNPTKQHCHDIGFLVSIVAVIMDASTLHEAEPGFK